MPQKSNTGDTTARWDEVTPFIDEFENAWQEGQAPAIEDHLPSDPALRRTVLTELIQIDLEYRLKSGQAASIDTYVATFPELVEDSDSVAAIRKWEETLKRRYRSVDGIAVPGYDILGEISRGGMGVVYKARQQSLNRIVALKMMLSGGFADASERARFRVESEALARLAHPNIVQVYELGNHEGRSYFTMEYVDGISLAEKNDGRAVDLSEAAALVETLGRAIHAAHERMVIHRDLKPANVLLDGPAGAPLTGCTPKITDFGLAKRLDRESLKTEAGAILGTPAYMAPEQALGKAESVGRPTDVYGLGVILYELATGSRPFRGEQHKVIQQVIHDDPQSPRTINARVPRDLETIIIKCLMKEPSRRYATALEMAQDLRRFLNGEAVVAQREPMTNQIWRAVRRRPTVAALGAVVLLSIVGLAAVFSSARTTRRITLLSRSIDERLLARDLSQTDVENLEQMIASLQGFDPADAGVKNKLLSERLARQIEEAIKSPTTLKPDEESRIRVALARLGVRDKAVAENLAQRLTQRVGSWRDVGGVAPPFSNLNTVFDPGFVVEIAEGTAQSLSPVKRGTEGAGGAVNIPTRLACQGNVRLEVKFRENTWEAAQRVGLFLYSNQWQIGPVRAVGFDSKGKTLSVADASGATLAWDVDRGSGRELEPPPANSVSMAFGRLGTASDLLFNSDVIAISDEELGRSSPTGRSCRTLGLLAAIAPAATSLALAAPDGRIRLWTRDGSTMKRVAELTESPSPIESMAVATGGARVAVGFRDGRLLFWEPSSNNPPNALEGHTGPVSCLAFSPDSSLVASGGADTFVRVWEVGTHAARARLRGHESRVHAVAFSPGGLTLSSGSADGQVRLWNVAGTEAGPPLAVAREPIAALAYAPDGLILAAGHGQSVTLWDLKGNRARQVFRPQNYLLQLTTISALHMGFLYRGSRTARALGVEAAAGRLALAQIVRNGEILCEQPVAIPRGALSLSAALEGDRLVLNVNGSSVVFEDSFPLGRSTGGSFGLLWPVGAKLERLTAWAQAPPTKISPLERGDDLWAAGQLAEAIDAYGAAAGSSSGSETDQEMRCKQAVCLLELGRLETGTNLLEQLSLEPGDRWPIVAAFRLWLLRLRQGRREEANVVFARLSADHPIHQIASLIPSNTIAEIIRSYAPAGAYSYIVHEPRLVSDLELARDISHYLHAPGEQSAVIKTYLAFAYHATDQLDRAAATFSEVLSSPDLSPAIESQCVDYYAWVLARQGELARAQAEFDRRLAPGNDTHISLYVGRARLMAQQGKWQAAAADIDEYFRRVVPEDRSYFYDACLVRGFVREALGDKVGAQKSWREGYLAASGTAEMKILSVAIMASLSGALTSEDARVMFNAVAGSLPGNVSVMQIAKNRLFGFEDIEPALRSMWGTPRGKAYARRIAFLEVSVTEYFSIQVPLVVAEAIGYGAFGGRPSQQDAELMWEMVNRLYQGFLARKVSIAHMTEILTTWIGYVTPLTWPLAAQSLDQPTRGLIAYMLANRFAKMNWKAAHIERFLNEAVECSAPDSLLRIRAQETLKRLFPSASSKSS